MGNELDDILLLAGVRNSNEGGEPSEDPEDYFKAGLFLLKRERYQQALGAFRQALSLKKDDARYMSYFGLCLAKATGRVREGATLCETAARKEFFRPEMFLNLGMVYVLGNEKKKAHMVFRKGLSIDRDNADIKAELMKMGVRKSPVFPFLDRQSPVNKLAGKVLSRLHLR